MSKAELKPTTTSDLPTGSPRPEYAGLILPPEAKLENLPTDGISSSGKLNLCDINMEPTKSRDVVLRCGTLDLCPETIKVSKPCSFKAAEMPSGRWCSQQSPMTGLDQMGPSEGESLSDNASTIVSNALEGQQKFTFLSYCRAWLRHLIRAIGASMLGIIGVLVCYPWLKFLGREAFLGVAINSFVVVVSEAVAIYKLFEEREHIQQIVYMRLVTFVNLLIMLYLARDYHLWITYLLSEAIQTTANAYDQYFYMNPHCALKGIRKLGFSIANSIRYRIQMCFLPVLTFGTFYINLNAFGIPNGAQVAITGIVFPVIKALFILQTISYISKLFGEKRVPWPAMEIALETGIDYPFKLSMILNFPFGGSFLTTVILNVILRITIRLLLISVIRYSEKQGSEKRHGRLVRYFKPLAKSLKYTVTFTEAGDCVATICAAVSALVITQEEVGMSLIYKVLVILLAEIGCNSVATADELLNGRLVPDYQLWVGTMPGLTVIRMFAMYLIMIYAIPV